MRYKDRPSYVPEADQNKVIVLAGIDGVGKSEYVKLLKRSGVRGVRFVELGDELAVDLRRNGVLLSTKDDIKTLDPEVVDAGIRRIVRKEVDRSHVSGKPAILIAHLVYKQGDSFVSLKDLYEEEVMAAAYAVIMGFPQDIIKRRKDNSKSRNRPDQTPDEVADHQLLLVDEAMRVASSYGADFVPLMSRANNEDSNLAHLRSLIGSISR